MTLPHRDEGIVINGAFTIEPPLDDETRDLLDVVAQQSLRAAIGERSSSLLERLAPGHPAGPSPWLACDEGCCLTLDDYGPVRLHSVQPWLGYLVRTILERHRVTGHVLWWDIAEDDHFALHVSGRQVRRRPLLGRSGRTASAGRPRALRSV